MNYKRRVCLRFAVGFLAGAWMTILAPATTWPQATKATMFPEVQAYIERRKAEFPDIPVARRDVLRRLATHIRDELAARRPVRLVFVCTHNSRRSQMAQIWAATAAAIAGHAEVSTYSGGTEATAFHPHAVAALHRAGFIIEETVPSPSNPHYEVLGGAEFVPCVCFSKRFDDASNPSQSFVAVMTCSEADKTCPQIPGAALRIAIPYDDPKVADGAPRQASVYDERCAQIAREMLFVFSQVE